MKRKHGISGFPEWLPEEKRVEKQLVTLIEEIYSSHGFTEIETAAVELMSTLASKGEVDKEIYGLVRARALDDKEAELGLHFDLTVPFARYVAQNFNSLDFPFRRYQLQKVWRGERPQKGRSREFYQFDVDTIAIDELPVAADAEVLEIQSKVFARLQPVVGNYLIRINNRKILLGFFSEVGLDAEAQEQARIIIDKLDKIGEKGVRAELQEKLALDTKQIDRIVEFTSRKHTGADAIAFLKELSFTSEQFLKGKSELLELLGLVSEETLSSLQVDMSLARGLDYYTGAIWEVHLDDHSEFGSAGGGGRYEGLTARFINKKLPGVGASIGLTRLVELVLSKSLMPVDTKCPTKVLVTVLSEEQRINSNRIAEVIRGEGVPAEVFFKTQKLGKQIAYADKKGIPYVLFIDENNTEISVKDIRAGEQQSVKDIALWSRNLADA